MSARLLFYSLLTTTVVAQPVPYGWENIGRAKPNQVVHVHPKIGDMVSGRFRSYTNDSIVIVVKNTDQIFARNDIQKVSLRTGAGRARNAAVGAGLGAGFSALLMGIALAASSGSDASAELVGGAMAGGAIWGGICGAIIPGYQTLYKAP